VIDIADFRERGKIFEATQIEVVEESSGRAKQGRAPRYIAVANGANPLAFGQRADDIGIYLHTANFFNFAARNWLAIGNQGERFKQCARVALRLLSPQPRYPRHYFLADLQAKAGSHFAQLDAAFSAIGAQ